jgi:hypothetical protein
MAIGGLVFVSACALNLPPVRVEGAAAEVAQLAGEWIGEYSSDDYNGRSGSIVFTLDPAEHFARGDVLMTPRGSRMPYVRRDPERLAGGRVLGAPSQSLTILFVRADNGEIYGELDPYWDPDLECEARTTFTGVRVGNTISGRFETRFSSPLGKTTGRWRVTRLETK